MKFNDYQTAAATTANYPQKQAVIYPVVGLFGEVGEVVQLFKREMRDNKPVTKDTLCPELGDVLWYVAMVARDLNQPLENVAGKFCKVAPNSMNTLQDKNYAATGTILACYCRMAYVAGVLLGEFDSDRKVNIQDSTEMLGEILGLLACLAKFHGITLEEVAEYNIKKLADRKARGVIQGKGDER